MEPSWARPFPAFARQSLDRKSTRLNSSHLPYKKLFRSGELLTAEADMSAESDLRHQMSNGTVVGETITRVRQAKLKAGAGFDVGASFAAQLSAGAGVSVDTTLSSTYTFIPNTTESSQNAMKLYVDLGNVLSGLPGPAYAFYNFAETTIEPSFLGPNLTDVEADVQAGLYVDATLDLGLPLGKQ